MNKYSKILIGLLGALTLVSGASFASASSASITVTSNIDTSVLEVGEENVVRWQTENFPAGAFVHINLIKKVSDSPLQYELVRQIAAYSVNDGEESWIPEKSDIGEDISIEVTCAGATRFKDGCVSDINDNSFAIESSFGRNVASVISAFFDGFLNIFR